jgi:hypothetical protein
MSDNSFETPRKRSKTGAQSIEQYIDEQIQLKYVEIEEMKENITATYKKYQQIINMLVTQINKETNDSGSAERYIGERNDMSNSPIYTIVRNDFMKQMDKEGSDCDFHFEFIREKDKGAMSGESGFKHYLKLTIS